jgi:hypothetical protein
MVWLLLALPAAALAGAAAYDWRQRRRGNTGRPWQEIDREAVHHRVDINAVPYEPARHAGQRDWATYRRRDRHRRR